MQTYDNTDMGSAIQSIETIWLQFKQCTERIRTKTSEAELLLLLIANDPDIVSDLRSSEHVNPKPSMFDSLPSSEPSDAARWDAWNPSNFALDENIRTIEELWTEWKIGSSKPSVEFMNDRFGPLAFAQTRKQRIEATTRQRIVEEIEAHLENGRELDEVLAVASLTLESYGNNMRRLAQIIVANADQQRSTLFEASSNT